MTPPTRPQPNYESLELRVESEPVRRRIEVDDRRGARSAIGYLLMGLAWFVFFVGLALLIAHFWPVTPDATPRPAQQLATPVTTARRTAERTGAPRKGSRSPWTGLTQAGRGAPSALDPSVGREGRITHMGTGGWPVEYLAIPLGPGVRVRICGPAACRDMVSTDAGPNHERLVAGVIADVSWQRFETLCGVPARMGACPGSWVRVTRVTPRMTLPPTDTP